MTRVYFQNTTLNLVRLCSSQSNQPGILAWKPTEKQSVSTEQDFWQWMQTEMYLYMILQKELHMNISLLSFNPIPVSSRHEEIFMFLALETPFNIIAKIVVKATKKFPWCIWD